MILLPTCIKQSVYIGSQMCSTMDGFLSQREQVLERINIGLKWGWRTVCLKRYLTGFLSVALWVYAIHCTLTETVVLNPHMGAHIYTLISAFLGVGKNKMRRCCYTAGRIATSKDRARSLSWLISFLSKFRQVKTHWFHPTKKLALQNVTKLSWWRAGSKRFRLMCIPKNSCGAGG